MLRIPVLYAPGEPGFVYVKVRKTGVVLCDRGQYVPGGLGRTLVHDDQIKGRVITGENGFDRRTYLVSSVPGADDDRDLGSAIAR